MLELQLHRQVSVCAKNLPAPMITLARFATHRQNVSSGGGANRGCCSRIAAVVAVLYGVSLSLCCQERQVG